jgi:hypothetical protein
VTGGGKVELGEAEAPLSVPVAEREPAVPPEEAAP